MLSCVCSSLICVHSIHTPTPTQPGHQADLFETERPSQLAGIVSKWRQKERLKTTAVSLVLCLNIGVDPPDVIRISPCARLECWVDPLSMQPPKALETIGTLVISWWFCVPMAGVSHPLYYHIPCITSFVVTSHMVHMVHT